MVEFEPGTLDHAGRIGAAIINQALADLQRFTPEYIADCKRKYEEAPDFKSRGRYRAQWEESSTEREAIIPWVGSPDFVKVVEWSGLDLGVVTRVFNEVVARSISNTEKEASDA